ncbi:MAG: methylenetetrahydrofolate--tRNA-(uracil(54)-C(5))-methyltransferase (FADH(2)-oxidizing) TrmFO [Sphingomonadales bacterium]|nr:methylenetetrahydrofolate--tRNA-(uracil(54)-C(5))-methyltransferase (FADH(2)-oxidizing) TrmFO [Sphingomonadales bacterium]
MKPIHVIGGGLAGSEATWQIAEAGVPVVLHEMRPHRKTDAHQGEGLAELVCSNSFRSDDFESNAVGVCHEEMRRANSIIMSVAEIAKVPAGSALAVDRNVFSDEIEKRLSEHSMVTIVREEVEGLPPEEWDNVIIATGPLTSPALSDAIMELTGEDKLAFFDALAPIVHKDSINFDICWFQSRYDKGEGKDYINCPMDKDQYDAFIDAMLAAEMTEFKEWEKDTPYFDGCMPIEVMVERGRDTPRFGPMKPVGLTDARTGQQCHAVVQLRQDNKMGTLYNIVGFQSKMKHGAQKEVFRMIPGLEKAEFARLGGLHRNTFLNSPTLLDDQMRLKAQPRLRFAGQMTGVEGYVESAAMGLLAGRMAAAEAKGESFTSPPVESAMGALLHHITAGAEASTFQPMNINFGLMPALEGKKIRKSERKKAKSKRALEAFDAWYAEQN